MELLFNDLKRLNRPRNPDSTPLYARLQRVLHDAIEAGSLQPGRALPSERELAKLASLSRVTVRKAIAALVSKGLLTQRHGAGTFVSERIVKSFSTLTSFTDDLRARGLKPRSRFLERSVGEVTPDEAMALGLSPGALVVRLYRLRFAGEEPLAIERSARPPLHSFRSREREGRLPKRSIASVAARSGPCSDCGRSLSMRSRADCCPSHEVLPA